MTEDNTASSIDVEEYLETHAQIEPKEEDDPKKDKGPDLSIKTNKWGFTFMILFIAIIAYLIISPLVGIPPFEYNQLTHDYVINDLLITILGVIALLFLGAGIYFVWFKKQSEDDKDIEEAIDGKEPEKAQASTGQITFVYKKDENKE